MRQCLLLLLLLFFWRALEGSLTFTMGFSDFDQISLGSQTGSPGRDQVRETHPRLRNPRMHTEEVHLSFRLTT